LNDLETKLLDLFQLQAGKLGKILVLGQDLYIEHAQSALMIIPLGLGQEFECARGIIKPFMAELSRIARENELLYCDHVIYSEKADAWAGKIEGIVKNAIKACEARPLNPQSPGR
jgi:hypothetical protein